jgi:putative tryptophan/tyrosine transport system substrate-binding protein
MQQTHIKSQSASAKAATAFKLPAALLLIAFLFSNCWCSLFASHAVAAEKKVGILLTAKAPQYLDAIAGFKKENSDATFTVYDMKGRVSSGADHLKAMQKDGVDMIYAVGVYALQVVSKQKSSVPVVYSMVMNPPLWMKNAPANITGASMNASVERTFKLLKDVNPGLKKIGTIYEPTATAFLVERAKAAALKHGMELIAVKAANTNEALGALQRLRRRQIGAMWVVPARSVLQPKIMQQITLFSFRQGIPMVGLLPKHCEMGSLLSVQFGDCVDIGQQAGEMAAAILKGEAKPSDIPFSTARKISFVVNMKTAKRLGVTIPRSVLDDAKKVIK